MYRRIMVLLDGSPFAEQALPTAVGIARRTGALVELVNVHVPPFSSTHVRGVPVYDGAADDAARGGHRLYLESVAERLGAEDVRAAPVALHGPAFETLLAAVSLGGADLVVMASHGHAGPSRTWRGSISQRMLHASPVPLLLVRPGERTRAAAYGRIVVPCGSPQCRRVIRAVLPLAQAFGADLRLLRVLRPGQPAWERHQAERWLERLAASARMHGVRVEVQVEEDADPAAAILYHARRCGADLVAMGTHAGGALRRLLLGSVADRVLRGELAMLVCPVDVPEHAGTGDPVVGEPAVALAG